MFGYCPISWGYELCERKGEHRVDEEAHPALILLSLLQPRHEESMWKHHFILTGTSKREKANVSKKIQYNVCGIILRRQKEQDGWRTVITFRTEKSFESTGFDKCFRGYIFKNNSCFYAADPLMKSWKLFMREIFSVTKSLSKSHSSCICNCFLWVF